jgi:hypothetical protein
VGGTSLSSPLVAAAYALTGSAASAAGFAYANPGWFNDVTSGSNAASCTFTYLCTAGAGFDGPTGIGTPASAHPSGPPPVEGGTTGGSSGGSGSGTTTSPIPPAPAQPAQLPSSVSVAGATSRPARNGRMRVKLVCGGGAACDGVLKLQVRLAGMRAFGRAHFNIASGKSAWVVVKLSRYNLALLKKRHRLRVYGTALDRDGTTAQSSFMLHAPKRKKHHKR